MSYQRTTATQRKAAELAQTKYLHVSVQIGMGDYKDPRTGVVHHNVPLRTPPGKGGTARRSEPKLKGRAAREARKLI